MRDAPVEAEDLAEIRKLPERKQGSTNLGGSSTGTTR